MRLLDYNEALKILSEHTSLGDIETIGHDKAYLRVLREDIFADRDYPPFNRSAMDGFAVSSKEIEKGTWYEWERVLPAGENLELKPGEKVVRIMTGAPVPEGMDSVIKIEDCKVEGNRVLFNFESIHSFLNIAKKGEDIQSGDKAISSGTLILGPIHPLLASLGKSKIKITKPPRVRIIITGSEIKGIENNPNAWEIRDSNSYTIQAYLSKYNIQPLSIDRVPDDKDALEEKITAGLDSDFLLLTGGVSMGELDYVPNILEKLGVQQIFHKVSVKPGKPLWFGKKNRTLIFGFPGNPFSVQTSVRLFFNHSLRKYLGLEEEAPLKMPLGVTKTKKHKLTEFFPTIFQHENGKTVLVPETINGSGDIMAGINSHGIGIQPANIYTINQDDYIDFYLY